MLTAPESPQIPPEYPVLSLIDPSVWMGYDPQHYAAPASNSYRSKDELVSPSIKVFWSGIPQLLVLLVLTACAGPVEDVPPTGQSPTRSAINRPQAEELPTESQSLAGGSVRTCGSFAPKCQRLRSGEYRTCREGFSDSWERPDSKLTTSR